MTVTFIINVLEDKNKSSTWKLPIKIPFEFRMPEIPSHNSIKRELCGENRENNYFIYAANGGFSIK